MVQFHFAQLIGHPRQRVFDAYRDHLPELVPYLPNCERIELIERKNLDDQRVEIRNLWHANVRVPRAARRFVKDELMSWYDTATWDANAFTVDWVFALRVFAEAAHCQGHNVFEVVSTEATRYILRGELTIDLEKMPFVPRVFKGLAPRVEQWLIASVQPNLESIGSAVQRYLDDKTSSR